MNIQAKQNVNGWNGISFGDHCALEGDLRAMDRRWNKNDVGPIPSVFCNKCDAPASVLCQLYGHLMPCASCLNGKRIEDVCLPSCRTCLFCFVPLCGLLHLAWSRRCVVYMTVCVCLILSRPTPWVYLWSTAGQWSHQAVCCHHASDWLNTIQYTI